MNQYVSMVFTLLLAAPTFAAGVQVDNAWIREPAPGQQVVGGFLDITSADAAALIRVHSPVAGMVEMHVMKMDNGTMTMRPMERISLPKGEMVKLEPGGLHLMLEKLKRPLKAGDKVPLTLVIRHGQQTEKVKVIAEVRGIDR